MSKGKDTGIEGHESGVEDRLGKFFWLLISLLILLVAYPFLAQHPATRLLGLFVMVGAMIAGIAAVSGRRRHIIVGIALSGPACLAGLADYVIHHDVRLYHHYVALPLFTAFWAYTTVLVFAGVIKKRHFDKDTICGAVAVYLLLGISWSFLFVSLEQFVPGSFGVPEGEEFSYANALYLSFLTLTTIGYGDLLPTSNLARTFSFLEGVTGVLYIAVFVARMVSLYGTKQEA